ncbi:MAG: phosphatase PAP2 family protein [Candidatus Woesearchaeota archaeon]
MLGYICGEGYQRISHYTGMIVTLTLGFIILIVYGYYIINRKKHVFTHSYIYFLILNIFTAYVFAKILQSILAQKIIINIDAGINQYIATIAYPLLTSSMNAVAIIFDPIVLGIISFGFCIYLMYIKKWDLGLLWLLSMGSAAISVYLIKLLVHRPRPEAVLTDFSFPSGHAAINILFFCLLFYCFKDTIKTKKHKIQIVGAIALLVIGIGFNRIYLHAHWLSDVIGGYAVGLFWLAFYILILKLIFYKAENNK